MNSPRSATVLRPVGVLALAVAAGAYWFRWHRRNQWLETVRANNCRAVPPLPHVGVVTAVGMVLRLVAAGCFLACLPRSRPLLGLLAGTLLATALLGTAGGVLVLVDTPTKASDGLDGSGLPCPSG